MDDLCNIKCHSFYERMSLYETDMVMLVTEESYIHQQLHQALLAASNQNHIDNLELKAIKGRLSYSDK